MWYLLFFIIQQVWREFRQQLLYTTICLINSNIVFIINVFFLPKFSSNENKQQSHLLCNVKIFEYLQIYLINFSSLCFKHKLLDEFWSNDVIHLILYTLQVPKHCISWMIFWWWVNLSPSVSSDFLPVSHPVQVKDLSALD